MSETIFACDICEVKDFCEDETIKNNCGHEFCIICLSEHLKIKLNCKIKCPVDSCSKSVSDYVIRQLLDQNSIDVYEKLCADKCKSCHRCLLPECGNYVAYHDKDIRYDCNKCSLFNCIVYGAAHKSLSCDQYKLTATTTGGIACQNELDRAQKLLQQKSTESNRKSILEAANKPIVPNAEIFTCPICNKAIQKEKGVQLKNCFHHFCGDCLKNYISNSKEMPIRCPDGSCQMELEDSECRYLLSVQEIENYEYKSLCKAMPALKDSFQCKFPNCKNLVLTSGYKEPTWTCNLCKSVNCLKCRKVHEGKSCEEAMSPDEILIKEKIKNKELMECPTCKNIIRKRGGCNWTQCPSCNTELCWILQTYRWGPNGRGDISGGCKCGVNGIKCHVLCDSCIPHNGQSYYTSNASNASNECFIDSLSVSISDDSSEHIPVNPFNPVQNTAQQSRCQII